jgi:3',5'-cyclic AMP phosphodiesterase CpdA
MSDRALTRRELVRRLCVGAGPGLALRWSGVALGSGLVLDACGSAGSGASAAPDGSTLRSTWTDPDGSGILRVGPGEPLLRRTELGPASPARRVLATLAHVTDAHVLDAQSPARVPFLARLGAPFTSTFRPHETLTTQVLAGVLRAVSALGPDAVVQGGDLIDNAQENELEWALAALAGRSVTAASGGPGYHGVQEAGNPDPLYYRPDLDAPRHPGMLVEALAPLGSPGLRGPWYPVLGDHDLLVAGVLPPSPLSQGIAVGSRAVWELPTDLPADIGSLAQVAGSAPDGLGDPVAIGGLVSTLLGSAAVDVPSDPRRGELAASTVLSRLRAASRSGGVGPLVDYSFDVGQGVRVIVLDLVRRDGGSGGVVHPGQPAWLAAELAGAGERTVVVFSHQPLDTTAAGPGLLAELDRSPHVLAAIWGHTHRNRITPRPGPNGGYWLISTASLIDHPQQSRALRVVETARGVALETWMLDHVSPPHGLARIARELAYLDAQGGRPQGFAGEHGDRNAVLYTR